jgi:hypothetical protein
MWDTKPVCVCGTGLGRGCGGAGGVPQWPTGITSGLYPHARAPTELTPYALAAGSGPAPVAPPATGTAAATAVVVSLPRPIIQSAPCLMRVHHSTARTPEWRQGRYSCPCWPPSSAVGPSACVPMCRLVRRAPPPPPYPLRPHRLGAPLFYASHQ